MVDFKTAQIKFKLKKNLLPENIQKLFQVRISQYHPRGVCMYQKEKARTNVKQRSVTVKGVNLWNDLKMEMKLSNTLYVQSNIYNIISKYETKLWT